MLRAGKWISTRDLVGFGFLEITNRAAASCLLSFSAAEKTILNFIKPLLQNDRVSFQYHHFTILPVPITGLRRKNGSDRNGLSRLI